MKNMNCRVCGKLVENVGEESISVTCPDCTTKELDEANELNGLNNEELIMKGGNSNDNMAKEKKERKKRKKRKQKEVVEQKEVKTEVTTITTEIKPVKEKARPKSVIVKELAKCGKTEAEIVEATKIPLKYVQAVIKKAKRLGILK